MRNPFTGYPMTQGWSARHPAVDYATPVGVEFTAPADGVYRHRPPEMAWAAGQAGRAGDLLLDDGRVIRFCHLSRHIAPHGARVTEGRTVLAATGNTGYVLPRPSKGNPSSGAHMHTTGFHRNGARWDWTEDAQEEEEDMALNPETDYQAFLQMIQRALKFDVRPNGAGADAKLGRTLFEQLTDIERRQEKGTPIATIDYDKLAAALLRGIAGKS